MTETPQELIARLMQHVEDTMVEASVDYPVEFRAGSSISYDSNFLQKCFETELAAALPLPRPRWQRQGALWRNTHAVA
jgi:hypothetical protein